MSNILQLALEFQQSPSNHGDLTDPSKSLPDNIEMLLEIAAGEVESSAMGNDAVINESISHELLSAATYFIEHALFIPKGNHYRTMGVETDADQEKIRKHFHLLLKVLHLDRPDRSAEWNIAYAMRINHAYSILRDPIKRRSYDQVLSKQGIRVVTNDKLAGKRPEAADPGPSRAVLADLLTTYKENDRNKPGVPGVNPVSQPSVSEETGSAQAKVAFIAGNVNKEQNSQNKITGQDKAAGQAKVAGRTAENRQQEVKNKAPISRELTDKELDSFQRLISTQPTQSNKLFGLAKNNTDRYRSVTAMLCVLLLVVIIIYVYQEISEDTGVKSDATHVQAPAQQSSSFDTEDDLGNESTTLPVEEPLIHEDADEDINDKKSIETQSVGNETIPSASDTEQRRRRTIGVISTVASGGIVANGDNGDKVSTSKSPITNSVPIKSQAAPVVTKTPQKPAAAVGEKKPASSAVVSTSPVQSEKMEGKQNVSAALAMPDVQESNDLADAGTVTEESRLSAPSTFVSMAPKQTQNQIRNTIEDSELKDFIADFIRGYESGDLTLFMGLFAEDAQTSDQSNRQGIRKDYQELFQGTEKRQFIIDNLQWKKEDNNRATGVGNFEVIIQAPGKVALSTITGKVTFEVQKGAHGIVIKRLEHAYQSSGVE